MSTVVTLQTEPYLSIQTREDSLIVRATTMADGAPGIHTWGPRGEAGSPAAEITYDALARLVVALTREPDLAGALGERWQDALDAAHAQYLVPPTGEQGA